MADVIVLGMAGAPAVIRMAERRAIAGRVSLDEAFGRLSRAEVMQAALDGMPERARAAFAMGQRRAAAIQASRAELAEQARLRALDAHPHLARTARTTSQQGSSLSAADATLARALFARMAQPLTQSELDICRAMGVSNETFKAQRDDEIAATLPGAPALSDAEKQACTALNVSHADFLAEKNRK